MPSLWKPLQNLIESMFDLKHQQQQQQRREFQMLKLNYDKREMAFQFQRCSLIIEVAKEGVEFE